MSLKSTYVGNSMKPKFDEKWFFGEIKRQLDIDTKMLRQIVDANPEKDPSSFSTATKEKLRNFPTELPGGVKIGKRRFVRLVRKACRGTSWKVYVHGDMLKAKLRGNAL